jgi:hypothetical protein
LKGIPLYVKVFQVDFFYDGSAYCAKPRCVVMDRLRACYVSQVPDSNLKYKSFQTVANKVSATTLSVKALFLLT